MATTDSHEATCLTLQFLPFTLGVVGALSPCIMGFLVWKSNTRSRLAQDAGANQERRRADERRVNRRVIA